MDYLGEIIGREQAENLIKQRNDQNEPNYILYLREVFESKGKTVNEMKITVIDAKNYSNEARFINHSCEPNLFVLPVRINNIVPHAALFALRDINEMEELSYDYNGTIGECVGPKMTELNAPANKDLHLTKCFCGSPKCKGYLPNNTA
jgi:histone-lysine N-methyltransferase SETMAR